MKNGLYACNILAKLGKKTRVRALEAFYDMWSKNRTNPRGVLRPCSGARTVQPWLGARVLCTRVVGCSDARVHWGGLVVRQCVHTQVHGLCAHSARVLGCTGARVHGCSGARVLGCTGCVPIVLGCTGCVAIVDICTGCVPIVDICNGALAHRPWGATCTMGMGPWALGHGHVFGVLMRTKETIMDSLT